MTRGHITVFNPLLKTRGQRWQRHTTLVETSGVRVQAISGCRTRVPHSHLQDRAAYAERPFLHFQLATIPTSL